MKLWNLAEDKLPSKLFVAISHEIDNEISCVESKNTHSANGETYANIFGHDIAYTIETDWMGRNYVNVFYFDLNPEEYGLRERRHKKSLLLICETKLQRIIAETIRNVLYN